jgi:hypothetical protein
MRIGIQSGSPGPVRGPMQPTRSRITGGTSCAVVDSRVTMYAGSVGCNMPRRRCVHVSRAAGITAILNAAVVHMVARVEADDGAPREGRGDVQIGPKGDADCESNSRRHLREQRVRHTSSRIRCSSSGGPRLRTAAKHVQALIGPSAGKSNCRRTYCPKFQPRT